MAGLLILAVIGVYVFLSKFIIKKVYEKTQSVKMKYIALAVMVLIPTWDIVLGYPIYAYLCLTKAGVHIYKTIDNVEGFYVGEKDAEYEPYEPYKGYKYIEYQEVKHQKPTGKYYRSYWVNFWEDANASKNCVPPRYEYDDYAKAIKRGQCIVKEEIMEKEVSQWEIGQQVNDKTIVIPNYITRWTARIIDRSSHKSLAELLTYNYGEGWVAIFFSSVAQYSRWSNCTLKKNYEEMLLETLKPKKGEN
jgi:hypothetical protein